MKPAITILDYLWSGRNTWLKHHEECACAFDKLAAEHIENSVTVDVWAEVVVVNNMPTIQMIRMYAEDWDNLCGPAAEKQQLQELLDVHMDQVTQIMAIQATKERQSSE